MRMKYKPFFGVTEKIDDDIADIKKESAKIREPEIGCSVGCFGCGTTCIGACFAACVGACIGNCAGSSMGNMKPPVVCNQPKCMSCSSEEVLMSFPVTEDLSLYLEKLLTERISLQEIIISVGNDPTIENDEKFQELMQQYKDAFVAWDYCYIMLAKEYVPAEYMGGISFSFNEKTFVYKGEVKNMSNAKVLTEAIESEEKDTLQNSWYDREALHELIKEGSTSIEVMREFKEANRIYQKTWNDLLKKYFPSVDTSTNGTASWTCDFEANTVTVTM